MTISRLEFSLPVVVVICAALVVNVPAAPAESFGDDVVRTLLDGQAEQFTAFVDAQTVIDRALSGFQANDDFVAELKKGLEQGLSRVGAVMINNLGTPARLTHVRTRTVDGVERVLVRVDRDDLGIDYLDFFVHEREDGSRGIYDWLDYAQGQTYSESLGVIIALMMQDDPSYVSRLFGLSEVNKKLAKQIAEMGAAGQRAEWSRWLAIYADLPTEVRSNRILLVTRMAAANASGDSAEYMNAMADLHEHHGNDPAMGLALVDYHTLSGDYAKAYAALDRVDELTGGDAALTNLRSGVALHAGDHAASIRYAHQAIAQDADFEDTYWNLMLAGARSGDYEAAMEAVRNLERNFGYEFSEDQLMANEEFSGLIASKEWKSGH